MASKLVRAFNNAVRRHVTAVPAAPAGVTFNGAIDDIDVAGLVNVGRGPIADIAIDGDRDTVVVTNAGAGCVTVINPETLAVIGSVRLGGEPFAAVVANDRAYVSVASTGRDAIVEVDTITGTVLTEYPLAFSVTALAVSPDGKRVFAGRSGDQRIDIAVIDTTAERVGTIDVATGTGMRLDALRVDVSGKRLYAATADERGSRLVAINVETAQVEATIWIGAPIRDVALGNNDIAYVLTSDLTDRGVVRVVELSAGTVIDVVEVGGAPTQLALAPDATRAYVVDYDRVSVLSTLNNEIVGSIDVGVQPSAVAVRADNGRLYIADYSGEINAFDTAMSLPALYPQFTAAASVVVAEPLLELEPAGV